MIALILGTVIPLGYLAAGFRIAVRGLPRFWRTAYAKWPNRFYESERRSYVKGTFIAVTLAWPAVTVYRGFETLIDSRDPELPGRRRKELEDQIAVLEREAGLPIEEEKGS